MSCFLYAILHCDRVLEQRDVGWEKGEDGKERGDADQRSQSKLGSATGGSVIFKKSGFRQISRSGCLKEDGDVVPIGGFSEHAIKCIENNGDQGKPDQNAV